MDTEKIKAEPAKGVYSQAAMDTVLEERARFAAEVKRLQDKINLLEDAAGSMRNTIHERSIAAQALQKTVERLQKELEEVSGLLDVAICPSAQTGCKDGVIPIQVRSHEWEPQLCQWCAMRENHKPQSEKDNKD